MKKEGLIRSLTLGVIMALSTAAFTQEAQPETAPAPEKTSIEAKATDSKESPRMQRLPFRGKITKIDLKNGTIILKGKTSTRVFAVTKDTKIMKLGKPAVLKDAKEGEPVGGYAEKTEKPDHYTLITLRLGPKPGSKPETESKVSEEESLDEPDETDETKEPAEES